jgi:hypothetical protein
MSRLLAAVALLVGLAPAVARAQSPGAGPPTPLAVDLSKVPVGSWAEYKMIVGANPPMKSRMALVARNARTHTLEMSVEGGALAQSGGSPMVMQSVVDVDQKQDTTLKKIVMQLGQNDPMDMPVDPSMQRQFHKPDPKKLVKQETIKVAAGSFKTKHYRDKTPQGDQFDFWVTETVPPFGLVKIEGPQGAVPGGGSLSMELTALGKDAKTAITKPVKPFDQALFMKQAMGGAGAAEPAPAPAPKGK